MKNAVGPANLNNYVRVTRTAKDIILCEMHGYIDGAAVRVSIEQTQALAAVLRKQGLPLYLLIDARAVTGQDSEARRMAKKLGGLGLTKIAICNRNRALGMVIQYLIRGGGMGEYARVFRDPVAAMQWMFHEDQTEQQRDNTTRIVTAAAVLLLAGGGLAGWVLENDVLKSIVPTLKPMNPMVGVFLLLQAALLVLIKRAGAMAAHRTRLLSIMAVVTILFGWSVLVQTAMSAHFRVDGLLFSGQFGIGTHSGYASPRAAILFMLIGVMELAILSGQKRLWQQYAFHIASSAAFIIALMSVVGYGFGVAGLYNVTDQLPMPLNTAICMLLLNFGLQSAANQLTFFARALRGFTEYSQPVLLGAAIILITGAAWHQSTQNYDRARSTAASQEIQRTKDDMQDRISGYVSALRGYRSFFEASNYASVDEYHTFFTSSQLNLYYPGFNAISFARNVPANQRAAFTKEMRGQANAAFPTLSKFAIFPQPTGDVSYPVTYVQPATAATDYGFDLASNDIRLRALEKARDTNDIAATDTIDLNASRLDRSLPARPGFFITIPIYKEGNTSAVPAVETVAQRRQTIYGFVNAVFEDSKLFADIFKNAQKSQVQYIISNERSGEVLYTHNPKATNLAKDHPFISTVEVAGQKWRLTMYTTPAFGEEGLSRYLPAIVLSAGLTVAALATALSVTQVRRKEQALALADSMTEDLHSERDAAITIQQKDEAILSSIGDAVFAIDSDGTVILFNRAAELVTGHSAANALGKPYRQLFHFKSEKNNTIADTFIREALSGKQSKMADDTILVRSDGTVIPVADSAAPIRNAKDEVEGAVVVFRDVTQEREFDRMKNEFVSMASHELRTPMGAIRAFISMILAGDYGPVNKNLVEPLTDIRSSTLRMVNLVNDLLNVARIEAGKMVFTLTDISLKKSLQGVANNLAPLAKEKKVALKMSNAKDVSVQADEGKVVEILTNLVGNSLKFTDTGSITLAMEAVKDKVEVTVTDTGTGISEEDRQKLFSKFAQVSSAQHGRPTGTGLGLYISREMVRKMGGDLWIKQSAVGGGTTFAFTLPKTGTPLAKHVRIEREREQE